MENEQVQSQMPKLGCGCAAAVLIILIIIIGGVVGGSNTTYDPCAKYSGDDRTACQFHYVNQYEQEQKNKGR